jgi:hypothetical protein
MAEEETCGREWTGVESVCCLIVTGHFVSVARESLARRGSCAEQHGAGNQFQAREEGKNAGEEGHKAARTGKSTNKSQETRVASGESK